FSSLDSYQDQLSRGLVRCPVCHSDQITRRVSAPHLNVSHLRAGSAPRTAPSAPAGTDVAARAAVAAPSGDQMARLQAEVLRQIHDVGARFADEARRMHSGEIEERPIRGTASVEECRELVEEGISIMPIPDILDDDRLQ